MSDEERRSLVPWIGDHGTESGGGYRFFSKWAESVLRLRVLCLAVSLGLTGWLGWVAVTSLSFDHSSRALVEPGSAESRVLASLGESFGQDQKFLVVISGDVFTPTFLAKLSALHLAIEALEFEGRDQGDLIHDVRSLANARTVTYDEEGLHFRPLRDSFPAVTEPGGPDATEPDQEQVTGDAVDDTTVDDDTTADDDEGGGRRPARNSPEARLEALQRRVLGDPALVGRLVSADGEHAAITVRPRSDDGDQLAAIHDALTRLVEEHHGADFDATVTGLPALDLALGEATRRDAGRVVGGCLLAMLFILLALFRRLVGVLGPLLVSTQALACTAGVMALLGDQVTSVTSVLSALVICVGMADAVHVQTAYRDLRATGEAHMRSLVRAVGRSGVPILLTSLTTIGALLSFRTASLSTIVAVGTYGAMGIGFALLHSLIFLPSFLSLHEVDVAIAARAPGRAERFVAWCDGLSRPTFKDGSRRHGRRRLTIVIALLIGGAAFVGTRNLESHHDPAAWLSDTHPAAVALRRADEQIGGAADIALLITAPRGQDLRHHDVMARLGRLESHILDYRDERHSDEPIVTTIVSILDVLREAHRAHTGDPHDYSVPEGERETRDALLAVEAADGADVSHLMTADGEHALMTIRTHWLDAGQYGPLTEHIREGVRVIVGNGAHVDITGSSYAGFAVTEALMTDLIKSALVAFGAVTLLMVLLLGDFRLGVASMVPNLLPIGVVMGTVGALGIPIDLTTVLVVGVALGIVVDDTIHIMYEFHTHESDLGTERALTRTLEHGGRAMLSTTLVLAIGFLSYALAEMANVRRFGLLVSATLVIALLVDLIFTPALLRTLYKEEGPLGPGPYVEDDDELEGHVDI